MSASVSRSAAEASTSSGRRKLRLLGLHGWRTSAAVLHGQLTRSGWHQQLGDLVEITFVDAPHAARGPSSPDVTLAFGNQPFYEWWDARQAENGDWRFHGWSESKAFVEKFLREHGPFDGFLGFSQGGILASALLAMAQQGTAMEGIPPMKVAIVIGSMASRAAEHQSAFKLPVTVPSIHVYGEKDPLKRGSIALIGLFQDPLVISHPDGHKVPTLPPADLAKVRALLESVRDSAATHAHL